MSKLVRYIRHGSKPVGCVVAIKDDEGYVNFGWSFCSEKDNFSKKKGVSIATNRALNGYNPDRIPDEHYDEINDYLQEMFVRAERYFQCTLELEDEEVDDEIEDVVELVYGE